MIGRAADLASHLLRRRAADRRIGPPTRPPSPCCSARCCVEARRRLAELRARLKADVPIPADRLIHVPSVNDPACLAALRRQAPDLIVVSGTRIIARTVIEDAGARFVNVHAGITPRYRGAHGAYWAHVEGRPASAGVTVHLIDAGIDTGAILGRAHRAHAGGHRLTYPLLQPRTGATVLLDSIGSILDGDLEARPSLDDTASKLWYHPGAVAYLWRRLLHGIR